MGGPLEPFGLSVTEEAAGGCSIPVLEPRFLLGRHAALKVEAREVHVWAMDLGPDAEAAGLCEAFLSPDELARARRFVRREHHDQFVLARGLMRHILSCYLDLPARAIRFEYRPGGKPVVAGSNRLTASFNVSHSYERAVLAVSDGREVGIDVERERPDVDILPIARSSFFRSEFEAIRGASLLRQPAEFFRYWVAKEAVLKGQGAGFGLPLDGFEILFSADRRSARVRSLDTQRLHADWMIRMLSLGPGWPVAVSARGRAWRLCSPGSPLVSRS